MTPDWQLEPLLDNGRWVDRNRVTYEGYSFVVARHEPTTLNGGRAPWCGWSANPNLTNVFGCYTAEFAARHFTDEIDRLKRRGLD